MAFVGFLELVHAETFVIRQFSVSLTLERYFFYLFLVVSVYLVLMIKIKLMQMNGQKIPRILVP